MKSSSSKLETWASLAYKLSCFFAPRRKPEDDPRWLVRWQQCIKLVINWLVRCTWNGCKSFHYMGRFSTILVGKSDRHIHAKPGRVSVEVGCSEQKLETFVFWSRGTPSFAVWVLLFLKNFNAEKTLCKRCIFFSLVLAILFQGNPQNFSVKLYTVGNSDRYMW